jgi:ribosomal-protein-alanine N-acetyltransferase
MASKTLPMVLLRTPRLVLREFEEGDWCEVYEYARLGKTVRYMPWGPNTAAQTKAFVRQSIAGQKQKPRVSFSLAVVLRSEDRVIGGCGMRIKDREQAEADMGYCLHPDEWGKGYGTELAKALLKFGFRKLKMHRIWATCDVHNLRSAKVLKKIGMKKEGVLREHLKMRGRWRSSYLFAVLSTDRTT